MDPRYPIGKFEMPAHINTACRNEAIAEIAATPAKMRAAAAGLTDAQLDTPYREGGWTVRQVVHHVADSHMNAFIRLRLALTEDNPTIKPYNENRMGGNSPTQERRSPSRKVFSIHSTRAGTSSGAA